MRKPAGRKVAVNSPCICCDGTTSDLFLRIRFVQYPGRFEYRRCQQCGLVYNSPRLQDLSVLYDQDYFLYHRGTSSMRKRVLDQIQHLILPTVPYAPGRRVLELGSARGHLLAALQQLGYEVEGLELSADAVLESRTTYHLPIFHGTAEEYAAAGHRGAFDVAIACTVIEHVSAPDLFVEACASLLKPGGVLAMDMPNIDSYNAEAAGPAWEMYQKYHVYLFSPATITRLLERHAFEVIKTFTYDNRPLSKHQRDELTRRRRLLLILDAMGLYSVVRSWYRRRRRLRAPIAEVPSITKEDLERLERYEHSRDATGPLASQQRGDHLVVMARKMDPRPARRKAS
jgi:2-polyprenyl-3-methyl-5-hydroxy-6-metoxy-1,4-benzoquinol methylase